MHHEQGKAVGHVLVDPEREEVRTSGVHRSVSNSIFAIGTPDEEF